MYDVETDEVKLVVEPVDHSRLRKGEVLQRLAVAHVRGAVVGREAFRVRGHGSAIL